MTIRSLLASTFLAAAASLAATAAQSETISLTATLSGANEVPPHDGDAKGAAEATLDTESRLLTYSIVFQDLTGPVIGAHLHGPVGADANAGILIPFETRGSPIEGSVELTEEQASAVLDGLTYVNIHTESHPGGELRGQLMQ